jgi:hypothetical protein
MIKSYQHHFVNNFLFFLSECIENCSTFALSNYPIQFLTNLKNTIMTTNEKKAIKELVESMLTLKNGSTFCGLLYTSKGTNETAQHVLNVNVSYSNAVKHDILALQNITAKQTTEIFEKGFSLELINQATEKLLTSFLDNQNKETASNGSIAQNLAYITITPCIKYNFETGLLYLYGSSVSKKVLVKGIYKSVKSRELTLCQNEIKNVLNFKTEKYRNFIITPEQLKRVTIKGECYEIAD